MAETNRIICGNCLDIMPQLESDSIACCITDPPYNYEFVGKTWDTNEINRRLDKAKQSKSILVKNIPYGSGLAGGVRNARWYEKNRQNILEYQSWVELWGRQLFRLLKPGAFVLVFNSTRTAAHIQVALENSGLYARDIIVWRRHSGIPKGINIYKKLEKMGDSEAKSWSGWHSCLRNEWEAIVVLQKPLVNNYLETISKYNVGLFHAKNEQGFQSNIIEDIKRETLDEYNDHPTVKPLSLMEKLIYMTVPRNCGNVVLDPFAGSGTTLVAAQNLGIDYLGIEINGDYIDIAQKRLANSQTHYKTMQTELCYGGKNYE